MWTQRKVYVKLKTLELIYMKLEYYIADPAGNITVLVKTPVSREEYGPLAVRLLAIPEIKAEQVGYITKPLDDGDTRLEMMGGEFCGNAMRSAALLYARENGMDGEGLVNIEVSGSAGAHRVFTDTVEGNALAEMPLPVGIKKISFGCIEGQLCIFEGIAHLVTGESAEKHSVDEIKAILGYICDTENVSAAGIMFMGGELMRPAVYVKNTDSLIFENSCASGSAAAAACSAVLCGDGLHMLDIPQPGGVISTRTTTEAGMIKKLILGGKVLIGDKENIEI